MILCLSWHKSGRQNPGTPHTTPVLVVGRPQSMDSISLGPSGRVMHLSIPESAVSNDGIKLGIKSIMFSLPTLPVGH